MTEVYFPIMVSEHARQAMSLRGVTREDIFSIARNPEIINRQPDGNLRLFGKALCIVLAPGRDRHTLVTVLLRSDEAWDNNDMRNRGHQ